MLVYQRVLPISETPYGFCMVFSESRRPTPSELIPCLIQGQRIAEFGIGGFHIRLPAGFPR